MVIIILSSYFTIIIIPSLNFGHIWASSSIAFLHCKDFTHKQLDGDTDYVGCVWSGLPTHLGSHWGLNLAMMCLLRLESLAARAALINCGETLWGDYCSMPRRPTLLVTSCTKAGVLCCARRQIGHSLQGPAGGRNGAGGSNQQPVAQSQGDWLLRLVFPLFLSREFWKCTL